MLGNLLRAPRITLALLATCVGGGTTLHAQPLAPAAPIAQPLAPPGSTNHFKLWSTRHDLRGEEVWLVEQWGTDTLVVRLRSLTGRLVGEGSETLVLPLADLQRLQSFGPIAQPRRGWAYAALGTLAAVAVLRLSGERNQFRQSQVAGGAVMIGIFVAAGTQRNDRQYGWIDVPLDQRRASATGPGPGAPDPR